MKKNPQLPHVNSKYGAPMGRNSFGNPTDDDRSVRLFKVNIDSQGYDEGGAYWGISCNGHHLWCAMEIPEETGELEYINFVRAGTRNGAAFKLGLLSRTLKNPLTNIWRHRFKIKAQFAGNPAGAMHYIYEWDQMVQGVCFQTYNEAIDYLPQLIGKTNEDWI